MAKSNAERSRDSRARISRGRKVWHFEVDEFASIDFLLDAEKLSEADALDRAKCESAASAAWAKFIALWHSQK